MQLRYKWLVSGLAVATTFVGGYWAGRHNAPTKTITETKTVTVEKEVVRWKIRKVKDSHEYKTTITHKFPDGTWVQRQTDDRTTEEKDNSTEQKTDDKASSTDTKTVTIRSRANWRVGVLVQTSLKLPLVPEFGALGERRILGPFWLGVQVVPQARRAGISLSAEW